MRFLRGRATALKFGSIVSVVILVLVGFSTLVQPAGSGADSSPPSPGDAAENGRPLVVTPEAVSEVVLGIGAEDMVHAAWIAGGRVFFKSSRDHGATFGPDQPWAAGIREPANLVLASARGERGVALAFDAGTQGRGVYVLSSLGAGWGPVTFVGNGTEPRIAVRGSAIYLSYLHAWADGSRALVVLRILPGEGRPEAETLFAFNTTATQHALLLAGTRLHVVWEERGATTFLAHTAYDLSSRQQDGTHLAATLQSPPDADSLRLVGRGNRVYALWSEVRDNVHRLVNAYSLNGGWTWAGNQPFTGTGSNALRPAAAFTVEGRMRVAWEDDRAGQWQLWSAEFDPQSSWGVGARPFTESPAWARSVDLSSDGSDQVFAAWLDGREGSPRAYIDDDAFPNRPEIASILRHARRIDPQGYAPPATQSRAEFLRRLNVARDLVAQSREADAVAYLEMQVKPRMDGSLGGDPADDLLVEPRSQRHLTTLVDGLLEFLRGDTPPGTREFTETGGPIIEPRPPDEGVLGDAPRTDVFKDVQLTNVTSTSARVRWETQPGTVDATGVFYDYADFTETPTTVNDTTAPYDVTLSPLGSGYWYAYEVRAWHNGTLYWTGGRFYTGVILGSIKATEGATSATLTWTTNVPSTSRVWFGTESSSNAYTDGSTGVLIDTRMKWGPGHVVYYKHTVSLTNLASHSWYRYRVESTGTEDSAMVARSGEGRFCTCILLSPPAWQDNGFPSGFSRKVSWTTNRAADSEVRYGMTAQHGSTATTSGYVTSHSVALNNLASNTTYYYQVRSTAQADANDYGVREGNFTTKPITISKVEVVRQDTGAWVNWTTDFPGNSKVKYGLTAAYNYTVTNTANVNSHAIHLTGLTSAKTYHFQIESVSSTNANDVARTLDRTFTTQGIHISGVWVPTADLTTVAAKIKWNTSVTGDATVRYGTASIWEKSVHVAENVTAHSVSLTGLLPFTTYHYRAESTHWSNANDTNVSSERTFTTLDAQNDANTGGDAGNTWQTSTLVDLGTLQGAVYNSDTIDIYRYRATASQTVTATVQPATCCKLTLSVLGSTGTSLTSGTSASNGAAVTVTYAVSGRFHLKVLHAGPSDKITYSLTARLEGGTWERLSVDIGPTGDDDIKEHLPGIHADLSSGWGSKITGTKTESTALDPVGAYQVTSRQGVANSSFFLDLYGHSGQRYTDFLLTVQSYVTQEGNLSVYNGAGWVEIGIVEAHTAWWTQTFRLDHTLFYDALPATAGLNVQLRFSKAVKLDYVAALPLRWTTYIGSGSDDSDPAFHSPGVELVSGWVDAGMGYKNATSGAILYLNAPDATTDYSLSLRFDGVLDWLKVEQWDGAAWKVADYMESFSASNFLTTVRAYNVDGDTGRPGLNLKLRLTANGTIHEVTQITAVPSSFALDVGASGDNAVSGHEPGTSLFPNTDWASTISYDGSRSYRHGIDDANVYLNGLDTTLSYSVYVTYRTSSSWSGTGQLRQWNGTSSWIVLGNMAATAGAWKTAYLPTTVGPYKDYHGSAALNVLLEFHAFSGTGGGLDVDRVWFEADADRDAISDYGETASYFVEDTATHALVYTLNFPLLVEGRWEFTVQLTSTASAGQSVGGTVYVDGFYRADHLALGSWVKDVTFAAPLCTSSHQLRVEPAGSATPTGPVTVTKVRYHKAPTDPANNDTDGDGLLDKGEACAPFRTDPTVQDTDADNATDFEETYQQTTSASPSAVVKKGQDYTWNVTAGSLGFYTLSVTRTDAPPSGGYVGIAVSLDGQTRATVNVSTSGSGRKVTFAAVLYKGLHSLQVRWTLAQATGQTTVTAVSLTRNATHTTTPTVNDTDADGLLDGDELSGASGWVTSPRASDTDADGAGDGKEVGELHSDPTLKDTDGDGFADGIDLDPLHDLVVQLRIVEFIVFGSDNVQYLVAAGIAGNWTRTAEASRGVLALPYHNVSVDVRDDQPLVSVDISAWGNNDVQVDIAPGSTKEVLLTFDMRGPDVVDIPSPYSSCGDTSSTLRGCLDYQIRTFRVAKLNTRLLTPNDWSGVINGSTGLHRYQGEQRFAFVLLNVTDGYGNVAHADMETLTFVNALQDFSPNGLTLWTYGDPPVVPAVHGRGMAFDGTDDKVQTGSGSATALNAITTAMTVSLFFRPGQDYDSTLAGSAFHAFAERADSGETLWRFGWDAATDSLAFRIRSGSTDYTVSMAYSLHKGTWYHLAATLSGGYQRIFVDGVQVAVISGTPSVKTGTQILYVGYDFPSNKYLKGTVDEVAVYSVSKTAAALKAMATFVQGSNGIIVPRGLWYESTLNQTLNGPNVTATTPLKRMTVHANQFAISGTLTLDAYLNARPVQQVLSGNVTLDEAQWFVDQLRLNRTGKTTAFLLDVTDEFYTMGFVGAVIALAPNATVDNSLNHTASAPPTPWWAQLFNAIVSVAAIAWNAALAVAQFMINLVKWLVNIVVGLVIGLATGDWTYFVDNVVKPFVEAMAKLVKFIVDLVTAAIQALIDIVIRPILDTLQRMLRLGVQATTSLYRFAHSGDAGDLSDLTGAVGEFADVLAPLEVVGTALGFAFSLVQFILGPISFIISMVIGLVIGLVVSAFIAAVAGSTGGLLGGILSADFEGFISSLSLDSHGDPGGSGHSSGAETLGCGLAAAALLVLGAFFFRALSKYLSLKRSDGVLAGRASSFYASALWGLAFSVFSVVFAFLALANEDPLSKVVAGGVSIFFGFIGILAVHESVPKSADFKKLRIGPSWQGMAIPSWARTVSDGYALAAIGMSTIAVLDAAKEL